MSNDLNHGFKVRNVGVQRAGQAETLREYTWGGPDTGRDTRLIFEPAVLEELLKVSKASSTGRVVCMGAGFRVRVRRDSKGRVFETLLRLVRKT